MCYICYILTNNIFCSYNVFKTEKIKALTFKFKNLNLRISLFDIFTISNKYLTECGESEIFCLPIKKTYRTRWMTLIIHYGSFCVISFLTLNVTLKHYFSQSLIAIAPPNGSDGLAHIQSLNQI